MLSLRTHKKFAYLKRDPTEVSAVSIDWIRTAMKCGKFFAMTSVNTKEGRPTLHLRLSAKRHNPNSHLFPGKLTTITGLSINDLDFNQVFIIILKNHVHQSFYGFSKALRSGSGP